jgi:hypothetical protein
MLKQTLLFTAFVASVFSASAIAIASGYDPEDEARAWAERHGAAAEYGAADEAIAILRRAVAEVKADRAGAIAKFNHNEAPFRDRDLFVFCFNVQDGKFTAHEAMVGADVRSQRDNTGRMFGQQMYQAAVENKIVEVDFMAPLPGTTALAPKRAFLTRAGDQVCGVSAYRFGKSGEANN